MNFYGTGGSSDPLGGAERSSELLEREIETGFHVDANSIVGSCWLLKDDMENKIKGSTFVSSKWQGWMAKQRIVKQEKQ